MTNFNEIRIESTNNDDPFEEGGTPFSIINFGKKTRLVMENFKKCEETHFGNSEIMTYVVQEIKQQRKIFHKFAEGSIKFSNRLADYSIDMLFFADCFKNKKYSDEEFLDLLNDLSNASKENHRLTKELKNIITKKENVNETKNTNTTFEGIKSKGLKNIENKKDFSYLINSDKIFKTMETILEDIKKDKPGDAGMTEDLTGIQNFLQSYVEAIKECPYVIDSDDIGKIKEEITHLENNNKQGGFSSMIGLAAFFGIVVIATGPATAVAAAAVTAIDLVLSFSTSYSAVKIIEAIVNKMEITKLEKNLDIEAKELIEKIKNFSKNLTSIIMEINGLEVFWETQIQRIDELIKDLERLKETERHHFKDKIVNKIEKKWKGVEQDCKIYSQVMRNSLNMDLYDERFIE